MAKRKKINPVVNKQVLKHSVKKCQICGASDYVVLNVHRIVPKQKGGTYRKMNTVVICANCHAKVHAGSLEIYGWFSSSTGLVLNYKDENDNEVFSRGF